MELELNLSAGCFIDFAFGAVIKGKEAMVFQEYSPAVAPLLKDLEIKSLRPFGVLATNLKGHRPEQGAFTLFKRIESYNEYLLDPRFLAVKPLRDEGMLFLNDGNMFKTTGRAITVDSEADYALVFAGDQKLQASALFEMELAENSPNSFFAGKSFAMYKWNDEADKLLQSDSEAVVFRIRFFPERN